MHDRSAGNEGAGAAPTVVIGGGLAGMAAAWAVAEAGAGPVTVVERGDELGGLAGTLEQDGHFYPLAYHHVLHRDRTLLWALERIGALDDVRWRRIRMLFHLDGRFYDLGHPVDFLRFPMSLADKARFVRLMLRAFRRRDWSDWHDRSAAELVDGWAGPGVRRALFERLSRLKFDLPCEAVSGAWLGARLHFREGSAPLGYIPGRNWTKVLCDGVTRELRRLRVEIRTGTAVRAIEATPTGARRVRLADGSAIEASRIVSTVPTEVYRRIAPEDETAPLETIRYTAIVSAICVTDRPLRPEFYWMNLATLDRAASGLFRLESLNPTIGGPGETCLNFVTHVPGRDEPFFALDDAEIRRRYLDDFQAVFGERLEPRWFRVMRLPMYSPVFTRGYRNPPVRSARWSNVWFAGNYRTFPSIASTGTALRSGFEAAAAMLAAAGHGGPSLLEFADRFRLRRMPRA